MGAEQSVQTNSSDCDLSCCTKRNEEGRMIIVDRAKPERSRVTFEVKQNQEHHAETPAPPLSKISERKTISRKGVERAAKPVLMDPSSPLLHQACANDDVADVKHQLAMGWHVDSPDSFGRSALHHAALNGSMGAAKVLIEHGARLDIRSLDGRTPFNYAAENLKVEMLQYLSQCAQEKMKTPRIFRGTSPQPPVHGRGMTPGFTPSGHNAHDDSINNGHPASTRAAAGDYLRVASPTNGIRGQSESVADSNGMSEGQEMRSLVAAMEQLRSLREAEASRRRVDDGQGPTGPGDEALSRYELDMRLLQVRINALMQRGHDSSVPPDASTRFAPRPNFTAPPPPPGSGMLG